MHFLAWRDINRTVVGITLFLAAVSAHLADCISSCHKLKAQHCYLSLNGCFTPPSASHSPPTCPPPKDSICDITETEKNYPKTSSIQVACRISYKMIAIKLTRLFIQCIWRDCIIPQVKFRVSRNTKCANKPICHIYLFDKQNISYFLRCLSLNNFTIKESQR